MNKYEKVKEKKEEAKMVTTRWSYIILLALVVPARTLHRSVCTYKSCISNVGRKNVRLHEAASEESTLGEVVDGSLKKETGKFNVVLTHCTADFDSLASAVGLSKLWSTPRGEVGEVRESSEEYDDDDNYHQSAHYSTPEEFSPTYVVLPRGAHPGVEKFLSLHKHLFPIRGEIGRGEKDGWRGSHGNSNIARRCAPRPRTYRLSI